MLDAGRQHEMAPPVGLPEALVFPAASRTQSTVTSKDPVEVNGPIVAVSVPFPLNVYVVSTPLTLAVTRPVTAPRSSAVVTVTVAVYGPVGQPLGLSDVGFIVTPVMVGGVTSGAVVVVDVVVVVVVVVPLPVDGLIGGALFDGAGIVVRPGSGRAGPGPVTSDDASSGSASGPPGR